MRSLRVTRVLTALLLVASAALSFAAAWQRWGGVCRFGGDVDDPTCSPWQDHRFDALWPSEPWQPIGSMAQLLGLATVLLAVALVLVPTALGRRLTAWQRVSLVIGSLCLLLLGSTTLASGIAGHAVELPGATAFGLVAAFGLPVFIVLALFTRGAQGSRAGLRGGLVTWMLVLATPYFQVVLAPLAGGSSYDTSPWSEAVTVPFLLVAAVALRPWSIPLRGAWGATDGRPGHRRFPLAS
jgi:hypothetical protein